MIPVSEARAHLLALVSQLETEEVPLDQAAGRVLARDVQARRDQPPFSASAMDGYAVNAAEVELHAMFKVIGEAAAGHAFAGRAAGRPGGSDIHRRPGAGRRKFRCDTRGCDPQRRPHHHHG